MRKKAVVVQLVPILVLSFALAATAQNYYPADIGNTWVLESADGTQQLTYTLTVPDTADGPGETLLKIKNEDLTTGESGTDTYFVSVDDTALKLHKTVFELTDPDGLVTADFPEAVPFFPLQLELGDTWQIAASGGTLELLGLVNPFVLEIEESTIDFEVIALEDVVTPAGTFENCAKVVLVSNLSAGGFLSIADTRIYQWLAPNIGPIQYENSLGTVFQLTSSNVLPAPVPYDVTGDGTVNVLDLNFVILRFGETDSPADANGDGVVNILDLVLISRNFGG